MRRRMRRVESVAATTAANYYGRAFCETRYMTIEETVAGHVELLAAVRGGRPIVWMVPPQAVHAEALWVALAERAWDAAAGGVRSLVVVADRRAGRDVAGTTGGLLVSGLARAAGALAGGDVARVITTPEDALALLTRAALRLDTLDHLVLAWPEPLLTPEREPALDQLLAEVRSTPRFVLAWSARRLAAFLERHAHRAPIVGPLAPDVARTGAACRYHVVGAGGRSLELERILDAVSPARYAIWRAGEPSPVQSVELVLAADLPTPAVLPSLAAAGPTVVLVSGDQLPYLKAIAADARPTAFPAAVDEARSVAARLRSRVAELIDRDSLEAEVLLLDPLFERYEPAEVAAALVRLAREAPAVEEASGASAVWAKLFVSAGRRDRLRPGDLVGALINEVGLSKEQIGRIELRESHTTVEVAPSVAQRAAEGLASVTVRGRRLGARLDRKG